MIWLDIPCKSGVAKFDSHLSFLNVLITAVKSFAVLKFCYYAPKNECILFCAGKTLGISSWSGLRYFEVTCPVVPVPDGAY